MTEEIKGRKQEEEAKREGGTEEEPQVYSVKKGLAGWNFSRRDFLTAAATAAAAATATAVGVGGKAKKATAQPIQVLDAPAELEGIDLRPGQPFTKVWRFKNNTDAAWGEEAKLRLVGGDRVQAPASVPLPNAAPGEIVSVGVDMVAPAQPGDYQIEAIFQITPTLSYTMYLPIVFKDFTPPTSTRTPTPTATPCSCHGVCSCVGHCSCDPYCTCDTVHYWYPN